MPRGGYRKPATPAPVSGPGAFSRRTDGQVQAMPNIGESQDLQMGDRQRILAATRAVPLAASRPQGQGQRPNQMPSGPEPGNPLPAFVTGPTDRPAEPDTTGLPMGQGPGPEVLQNPPMPQEDSRAQVLMFLQRLGDPDAPGLLAQMRSQARPTQAPVPQGVPSSLPPPT